MLIPTHTKPTLESLPTELLIIILLQIPDKASLKSIVCSSPICHQAYLAARQEVLCRVLKTRYGGNGALLDFSEAITAVRSEGLLFESHKEEAIATLDIWRRKNEINGLSQTLRPSPRRDELGSLEETIKLFRLYEEFYFFLEDYTLNLPPPAWIQSAQWRDEILPIDLSCTEKRRFLRALCRLQILANIFGLPERDLELTYTHNDWVDNDASTESETEAYRSFYGTMPPWEYEEMGCVWAYLVAKYVPICKGISDDLRKLASNSGSRFFWDIMPEDQRPPAGCALETVEDLPRIESDFSELAAIGPSFLYRVLHSETVLQRNMIMANVRVWSENAFIGAHLHISWDDRLPFIYPADRHDAPGFEQLWSKLPPIEQPNIGWKRSWLLPHTAEQDLEDSLFYGRRQETAWEWGYAIWDAERLEEWNAPLENFNIHDP